MSNYTTGAAAPGKVTPENDYGLTTPHSQPAAETHENTSPAIVSIIANLASEINAAHASAIQHADKAIGYARQAGELLLKVKASLAHGEFLPWVETHCTVTPRQAQRYMSAAQGKPTPLRAIKPEAIKYDTVSHLEVKEGEAVYITRLAGNWQDEIHIYPDAQHHGSFHYAHVSGQEGHGASCSYTKRGIGARGIGLIVWLDLPGWRDAVVERMKHPGYVVNPFACEDIAEALGNVATPVLHKNLDFAREMVTGFIEDSHQVFSGNEHLFKMLDGGDEYEVLALPGDTLEAIVGNLHRLLKLAGEPLESSKPKASMATHQRKQIVIQVRAALKLLATENGGAA